MSIAIDFTPALIGFLPVWTPGAGEMLLLAVIALLLYGGELPQAARSWGRAFGEFRRHLAGIQREFNEAIYSEPHRLEYHPPQADSAKGEPTTGEPASAGGPPTPDPADADPDATVRD